MTDREMLEWAAKAAGIEFNDKRSRTGGVELYCASKGWWNPLHDDGDALRLAVKLQIHMQPDGRYAWASTYAVNATEAVGDDPYAATRRAIVRAAAEIGRSMEAAQ